MSTFIEKQTMTASRYFNVSVKGIDYSSALTQQHILSEIWDATEVAVRNVLQPRNNEKAALIQQQINFAGIVLPGDNIEIITQIVRLEQEMEIVVRLQKKAKDNNTAVAGAKLVYYVYNA